MIHRTDISEFLDKEVQILLVNQWIFKGKMTDLKNSILVIQDRKHQIPVSISLDCVATISIWAGGEACGERGSGLGSLRKYPYQNH